MNKQRDFFYRAFQGAQLADALAMPVHWYYNTALLDDDYGEIDRLMAPKQYHPDSILWRSEYRAENANGDILHDQATFWGMRGVHYHQNLEAGENTLNFKLATELYEQITHRGYYDTEQWLKRYVRFMLDPQKQTDTYVEEYHRGFFTRYARGVNLLKCGVRDEHIGGLAQVPALMAGLAAIAEDQNIPLDRELLRQTVKDHVSLTHKHSNVLRAADCLCRLLWALSEGAELKQSIQREAGDWFSCRKAEPRLRQADRVIIGEKISPACYIDQAFPASLYLSLKYEQDYFSGIKANAEVGGDNCHRAAVVGSVLASTDPEGFEVSQSRSGHSSLRPSISNYS